MKQMHEKKYYVTVAPAILRRFNMSGTELDLLVLDAFKKMFPMVEDVSLMSDEDRDAFVDSLNENREKKTNVGIVRYSIDEETQVAHALMGQSLTADDIKVRMVQFRLRKEAEQAPYNMEKYNDWFSS